MRKSEHTKLKITETLEIFYKSSAWHEIGHALLWHVGFATPELIHIAKVGHCFNTPDGPIVAYVELPIQTPDWDPQHDRLEKDFALAQTRAALGGMSAEAIFHADRGKPASPEALYAGCKNDISQARTLLRAGGISPDTIEIELCRQAHAVYTWLKSHHLHLKALSERLWARKSLDTKDFLQILGTLPPITLTRIPFTAINRTAA